MSLGWQTESALVPKQGKAIDVDGKSMVALKALVYSKEQQLLQKKQNEGSSGDSAIGLHRKKRSREANKTENDVCKDRKVDTSKSDSEDKVLEALKAKAEVYDLIQNNARGNTAEKELVSKYTQHSNESLVNFKAKGVGVIHSSSQSNDRLKAGGPMSESKWAWSQGKAERNTEENGSSDTMNVYEASYESKMALQALLDSKKAGANSSSSSANSSGSSSSNSSSSSSSSSSAHNSEPYSETVSEPVKGGRVKSQWEKTLSGDTREYLEQIHSQTLQERRHQQQQQQPTISLVVEQQQGIDDTAASSVVDVKVVVAAAPKSAKELRRELIRQQQLERGLL